MDKLKNIFSPGSKSDDQTMYGGDNAGKVAGEGSHFGDARTDHPAGASEGVAVSGVKSDDASTTALKDGVSGPYSETSEPGAIKAAQAATGTSTLPIYSEMTGQNTSPYSSHGVDARVDGNSGTTTKNTGLASAAAATAYNDKSNVSSAPATSTIGTAATTGSAPIGTSSAAHTSAPETTPSAATHTTRDAALGGAAGAAVGAASSANTTSAANPVDTATSGKPLGSLRDLIDQKTGSAAATQSSGSQEVEGGTDIIKNVPKELPIGSLRPLIDEKTGSGTAAQSSNVTDSSIARETALGAGTGSAAAGGYEAAKYSANNSDTIGVTGGSAAPASESTKSTEPTTSSDSHTARNAAIGAGAGAGLVGSYDYLRNKDSSSSNTGGLTDTSGPLHADTSTEKNFPATTGSTADSSAQPSTFQSSAPIQPVANEENKESHTGRDAAIGAGAGAAGAAAIDHHKEEEERKAAEKARKEHEKEVEKAQKEHDKEVKKAEKEHEKEIKKAEKEHEKEVKAAEKEHQKEVKAAEKEHEKQLKEQQKQEEEERKRHEKELAAAAGAAGLGAAGAAAYEHNKADEPTPRERIGSIADSRAEGKFHSDNVASVPEPVVEPTPAEDSTVRDKAEAMATSRAEGKFHSDRVASVSEPVVEPTPAEDPAERTRIGSIAESRAEGKVHSSEVATVGAGAAGVAAYEAAKDKDHEHDDEEGKKRKGSILGIFKKDKHDSDSEAEKHHSDAEHKERKGSILGIFKRDKNKDSDSEVEDKKHHGKEAAVGAGAIGAGAVGAHEYEKHHGSTAGTSATAVSDNADPSTSDAKVYRDAFGRLKSDPTEKSYETPLTSSGVIRDDIGNYKAVDTTATGAEGSHPPPEAGDAKVYRDAFGRLKSDPTERSYETPLTSSGVIRDEVGNYKAVDTPTTGTEDNHRGLEAGAAGAAVGAGAGAVAAHEHDKNKTAETTPATAAGETHEKKHHHLFEDRHKDHDRTSYASHPEHKDGIDPKHKHQAEAAGVAGGATALAAEQHDRQASGTTGDLGESRGFVNEGYVHHKTEDDIKAEKRNSIAGVGILHREGRFHGKEGGAPGAVGVPPEERDQAYIESQKHLPTLHGTSGEAGEEKKEKHSGILGIFHRDDGAGNNTSDDGPNKLHKDPPAGHPAAVQHAKNLPDNTDIDVQDPHHDPVGMGYTGEAHLHGKPSGV